MNNPYPKRLSLLPALLAMVALLLAACERPAPGSVSMDANTDDATETDAGAIGALSGALTGTVNKLDRSAIAPNAVIEVQLIDASLADAPSVTLAAQSINADNRQLPIPYELSYDPAAIDPARRYQVQARITVDGALTYISDTATPVLTGGAPTDNVEIMVVPAGGGAPAGGIIDATPTVAEGLAEQPVEEQPATEAPVEAAPEQPVEVPGATTETQPGASTDPNVGGGAPVGGLITGVINTDALSQLDPAAVLIIDLREPDTSGPPMVSVATPLNGAQFPLSFAVPFVPNSIDPERAYVVGARILLGDQVLYASPIGTPVLTQGAPVVDVLMNLPPYGQ